MVAPWTSYLFTTDEVCADMSLDWTLLTLS